MFNLWLLSLSTHSEKVPWDVASGAGGGSCPVPLLLGGVALLHDRQSLVHREAELVGVLGLVGERRVAQSIVGYAELLLNSCRRNLTEVTHYL